ncbi:hypothetical protein [Ruegeria marina]|nr:hypothetical protein [Ruegeria marina]
MTHTEVRFTLPVSGLLDIARARLARQTQYARALDKGGKRAEGLAAWFDQASACITALARPEAFFMPVTTTMTDRGVLLADRVLLEGIVDANDLQRGATITAYLLTLNYTQAQAFDWLGKDYGAHHVQSDLGGEVLFALGRDAHRYLRNNAATGRTRRIPVLASEQCGVRRSWDPARVQALLSVFDNANPGFKVTDTGCFQPLNSLLGLALHLPDD